MGTTTAETAVVSIKEYLSIGDSFVTSAIGFGIVFFVLVVLMFVIKALHAILSMLHAEEPATAPAETAAVRAAPIQPDMVPATGSLGEVMLHDVDDRTAAMLMAIVANELDAPLNELRFISIREKK